MTKSLIVSGLLANSLPSPAAGSDTAPKKWSRRGHKHIAKMPQPLCLKGSLPGSSQKAANNLPGSSQPRAEVEAKTLTSKSQPDPSCSLPRDRNYSPNLHLSLTKGMSGTEPSTGHTSSHSILTTPETGLLILLRFPLYR